MLVDASGRLAEEWWSIPSLPVAVSLFAESGRVAIERARDFNIDIVVVRSPVAGMTLDQFVRALRHSNPRIRTLVLYASHSPPSRGEIDRASPDFVASETIDSALLSVVVTKMLEGALVGHAAPLDGWSSR
ncbi:MAG: response regulator transcription factor [Deltaproteobacteria bacterium]|nr:response regulator transcription factor [Deltaproteobacteria bacterium]